MNTRVLPNFALYRYLKLNGIDEKNGFDLMLFDSEADWLEVRAKHIGASEAGTCAEMNWYKSRRQYWEEKTGRREVIPARGANIVRGKMIEPILREMYAAEHPDLTVFDGTNLMFVSKDEPWRSATLDFVAVDMLSEQVFIGEIKTGKERRWSDGVPREYMAQMAQQLDITKFESVVLMAQIYEYDHGELMRSDCGRRIQAEFRRDDDTIKRNMEYVRKSVNAMHECIVNDKFDNAIFFN